MTDYRNLLQSQLAERIRANSHYSLRAFARDLGVSPSVLSEVLNRKHGLSEKMAVKIAQRLSLSPSETEIFLQSVRAFDGRSREARESATQALKSAAVEAAAIPQLSLDAFRVVADWYHFAIIEYLQLKSASSDPSDIASALGISIHLVQDALQRLVLLEMIEKKRHDTYRVVQPVYLSPHGTPSEAIRNFHRQVLEKALQALTVQPLEQREFRNLMFAVDRKRVPMIKEKIQAFVRSINQEEARVPRKNTVYNLSVQLFELTPHLNQKTKEKAE